MTDMEAFFWTLSTVGGGALAAVLTGTTGWLLVAAILAGAAGGAVLYLCLGLLYFFFRWGK